VPGAPVVSPVTGKSGPYTNTLVGVTQQIVGVPVPALGGAFAGGFLRVQGTVTAIDDSSDEIRVKGGGNLLFKTSVSQLQSVSQNIQQSLSDLPGIGGMIPEPSRPSVSSSVVRDPNSRAYQVGDGIGIPGAGNLVYRGVQSDGYHHVASRTSDYRVPASVGYDKDAIRSWAIAAVANGAIGREGLYGAPAVGDGRPASPVASAPYRTGDYIGTPYGQLVFKGVADDGYLHVQTRTRDYRVPTELGNDRDAIRGWVINAIEHGGIDRSTLYPNKVSATLNEGAAVVSSTGERQVVRTSDNRELVVTMQDRSPVVTSEGVEVLRLREGTTLAQAAELVASRASPVLGQGVLVADAPNQNASQIPSRNVEPPQIGAYS
jgi:hypothetical protein